MIFASKCTRINFSANDNIGLLVYLKTIANSEFFYITMGGNEQGLQLVAKKYQFATGSCKVATIYKFVAIKLHFCYFLVAN